MFVWDNESPPLAPKNLNVATGSVVETGFTLTWRDVAHAASYLVERLDENNSWRQIGNDEVSDTAGATIYNLPVTGLVCGTSYDLRIRARGDGTNTAAELSTVARWLPDPTTAACPDAPAPVVTANPAQDSVTLSWTATDGVTNYTVEQAVNVITNSYTLLASYTTPPADHTVSGLLCNRSYTFRVSAKGDGTPFSETWARTLVTAMTTPCPAPPGLSLEPLPRRKARLTWTYSGPATRFTVQARVVPPGTLATAPTPAWDYVASTSDRSRDIELNNVFGEIPSDDWQGLRDHQEFQFRVLVPSFSLESEVVVAVVNPVLRVVGGSVPFENPPNGFFTVTWPAIPNATNYFLRYQALRPPYQAETWYHSSKSIVHFPSRSWEWRDLSLGDITRVGSRLSYTVTDLRPEVVYSVLIGYQIDGKHFHAVTESYTWVSTGGVLTGGYIAGMPINANRHQHYVYNICEETFPASALQWRDMINGAFRSWSKATDNLVSFTEADTILTAEPSPCNTHWEIANEIQEKILAIYNERPPTLEIDPRLYYAPLANFIRKNQVLTDLANKSKKENEIVWIDDREEPYLFGKEVGIFPEMGREIGLAPCGFTERACVVTHPTDGRYVSDMLLRAERLEIPHPAVPRVRFNFCEKGTDTGIVSTYATILHEIGHIVGIGSDGLAPKSHPISELESVVKAKEHDLEGDCAPLPRDVLAVFGLYQGTD